MSNCVLALFTDTSFVNKAKGIGYYDSSSDVIYYVSMMGNSNILHVLKINAADGSFVGNRIEASETCQQIYSLVSYASDASNNR